MDPTASPTSEQLYALLVRLLKRPDDGELLQEAIAGLADTCGAERVYLERYSDEVPQPRGPVRVTHRCTSEQQSEIAARTSRGIVAAALSSGKTVHTPLALLDARFADQPSVQKQRLEAVLCVPLPGNAPGVLYLEARRGDGPFTDACVALAEDVAMLLSLSLERSNYLARPAADDPTALLRQRLKVEAIVGRSPAVAHVLEHIALAAPLDITVLLTGESGTGKTQVARAIHDNSPRAARPFVELNCAAIPAGLFESELFGTMLGAFTGARRAEGKVEAAEGGTLFLDEVAELQLPVQAKLLQLLQSKQFYPLGGTRLVTANVRLIAASNADLEELVREKKLREDLYYRLNVFSLRMPTLAQRKEDIRPLLEVLISRACEDHGLGPLRVSPGFSAACEALEWPGNVRELRNRVDQAAIRAAAEGSAQVEARHLAATDWKGAAQPTTFEEATRRFQRDLLQAELNAQDWNVTAVAERLDLTRQHIYKLMRSFALERSPGAAKRAAEPLAERQVAGHAGVDEP